MKKIISIALALALSISSFSLASCKKKPSSTDYEKEYPDRNVYTYSYDIIGGESVMPVSVYYGPYTPNGSTNGNVMPDFTDEYYIKMLADAGIKLYTYCPESYPQAKESIQKVLTLSEKYNIGYYVNAYNITSMSHGMKEVTDEAVAEVIEDLSEYRSFVGFYSFDEPYYEYIEAIGKLNETVDRLSEGKYSTYVNLLPEYEKMNIKYTAGTEDVSYEQYVNHFATNGNSKYVSYDHYAFESNNRSYFKNMELVRRKAEENQKPFWGFIQAGGQYNDAGVELESLPEAYPTEGQLIWNVNTTLACGAKGMQYFLGFQPLLFAYAPNGTYDFTRNSFFGSVGNVNQWYYYAQKVNRQIDAIDEILMKAYNVGVIASDSIKSDFEGNTMLIESGEFHQLKGIRGEALIGCFEYQKRTVLYVVNYSHNKANDVILDLNDTHEMKIIQRGKTLTANEQYLGIHLEAGEGVLVEFVK
ncbi:MAG: hypothetical protein IJC87_06385 [Clostridia bacterium]|nr:hypothetical protein [Clostridia bacterium]